MRNHLSCALALFALCTPLRFLPAQASRGAMTPGTYAIGDVTLIPMTRDSVIRGATVVVKDGRIAAAGATRNVRVPAGARRMRTG